MMPLGPAAVGTVLGALGVSFPVAALMVYCEISPGALEGESTA